MIRFIFTLVLVVILFLLTKQVRGESIRECMEYQEIEITDCKDSTISNAVIGGGTGALVGYMFGGKGGATLGGLVGGAGGAATGKKKCVTKKERECVKWKTIIKKEVSNEQR